MSLFPLLCWLYYIWFTSTIWGWTGAELDEIMKLNECIALEWTEINSFIRHFYAIQIQYVPNILHVYISNYNSVQRMPIFFKQLFPSFPTAALYPGLTLNSNILKYLSYEVMSQESLGQGLRYLSTIKHLLKGTTLQSLLVPERPCHTNVDAYMTVIVRLQHWTKAQKQGF